MGDRRDQRDPAKTKRLSLTRDGRPSYGENDKAARKAIPRFKAKSNRAFRHDQNAVLREVGSTPDPELVDLVDDRAAGAVFRPVKRKVPDARLGTIVEYSLRQRIVRVGRKKGSRERIRGGTDE
jgi:hypothetical protein